MAGVAQEGAGVGQQHGFFHGGVMGAIGDRGAGGASPATGWCPCSHVRVSGGRIHDLVAR